MRKTIATIILLMFVVTLWSCAGQTRQQKGTAIGAGTGAAAGAVIGQALGRDTESTLIGAAIGGVVGGIAGNQIGAYMDRQEQELQNAIAASEAASLRREEDILTATFKGDVFFDFDSAALKPGAYSELDRIAPILNRYPHTILRVEGHTDTKGSEEYNQRLSERRAQAVSNALTQRGVDPQRIETVGYGETQPISSTDAMNRRVEVVIIPVQSG